MTKERIVSSLIRAVCFAYALVSLFAAGYLLLYSDGFQLPASVDPSLTISSQWLALVAFSQGIVVCSFLIAVAETLFDGDDMELTASPYAKLNTVSIGAPVGFVPATEEFIA